VLHDDDLQWRGDLISAAGFLEHQEPLAI